MRYQDIPHASFAPMFLTTCMIISATLATLYACSPANPSQERPADKAHGVLCDLGIRLNSNAPLSFTGKFSSEYHFSSSFEEENVQVLVIPLGEANTGTACDTLRRGYLPRRFRLSANDLVSAKKRELPSGLNYLAEEYSPGAGSENVHLRWIDLPYSCLIAISPSASAADAIIESVAVVPEGSRCP